LSSIVTQDLNQLIDSWLESENNGVKFPVPFDIAWQIAGYSRKDSAKRKLLKLSEGNDFHRDVEMVPRSQGGGAKVEVFSLSCDAMKHICLMAETTEGRLIRQYFIEAEKKWRLVEKVHPEIAASIELAKLQAEISRNNRYMMERSEIIHWLHGERLLAWIQNRPDVIIEKETVVTEVLDLETGKSQKILTADQLKKAVKDRTGQKLKTMKQFTDALREAGRDDLLVPVNRPQVNEYVIPDRLDEAISIVYGRQRQKLLGE
jgi:phage anti-repressor protein